MDSRFLYKSIKRSFVSKFLIKLFQIMGRTIDEQRVRPGQRGQEQRVRPHPAVTQRGLIEHFEARRLVIDQKFDREPRRRQLGVLRHVLEPTI